MYRVLVRDRSASSANAVRLFGTVSVAALAAMMAAPTANAQTAQQLDDIYINDGQGTVQPGSGGAGGAGAAGASTGGSAGGGTSDPNAVGNDVTITRSDIELKNPMTIQGLFSAETAVRAGGTTPSSTKVYVNGIEETLLNVQIDGARQPQRSGFHHNNNSIVDPEMLKGVAIDGGGSAADVGPHTLGGSIRYMTVDPDDLLKPGQRLGAFAKLSFDTNSKTFAKSGSVYGKANGFEILGYGNWAEGDPYKDGDGNTVIGTDVDLTNYLGKFAYEAPSGHRFAFSGEHIQDEGIRPFRANLALVEGYPNPFSFSEIARDTYTFKYTSTKPTSYFDPEVSFYYNKNVLNRPHPKNPVPFGPGNAPPPYFGVRCLPGVVLFQCTGYGDTQIESIGGKIQNTIVVGPGKLTAGTDFYRDESEVDHGGDTAIEGERATDIGVFAQYRFEPVKGVRLSTGSRFDWHELEAADGSTHNTSGASPNISGELDILDGLTAKASYGRSFGGIPLAEVILIRDDPFFGFLPLYSSDLEAQYGQQAKGGLAFAKRGFSFEGYYFRTTIFDPVEAGASPPEDPTIENLGDLVSKGYNLSASYSTENSRIAVSFQHTDTTFDGEAISTTSWFAGTPQGDMLVVSGHYRFAEANVLVGFISQFAFEYDDSKDVLIQGEPLGVLPAYNVHHVYAQWNPTFAEALTLRVDVHNVFDEQYVDRSTAIIPTGDPLTSPGRAFVLSGKLEY